MSRILIGNVRDKLINNLLATKAGTGALDAAQGKVLKDLVESVLGQQADVYSKKTYAVGDYCIHENTLHKCSTAISSAEEWTAGHWTKTTIATELKSIVGSVATINSAITELNGKTAKFNLTGLQSVTFAYNGTNETYLEIFFWLDNANVYLLQLKHSQIGFHYSTNGGATWNGIWMK